MVPTRFKGIDTRIRGHDKRWLIGVRSQLIFGQPALEPFHALLQSGKVLGGKTPAQPTRRFGGKGFAWGQPQTSFGDQPFRSGHRVRVPFELKKRVHPAFGRGQLDAGHGLQC